MGYYKNLMIDLMNEQRHSDQIDTSEEEQADDWSRITGLGFPLPEPEDFRNNAIPF